MMNKKNNSLPGEVFSDSVEELKETEATYSKLKNAVTMWISNYGFVVLLAITVASSGTALYFYNKSETLQGNSQAVVQQESKTLVAQIGRLIVLPDEEPTIATVSDPDVLKNQPFFAKAKKGDRVLLYANAKKAILYDPVNDKIIEVAPIVIGAPASQNPVPTSSKK